ncbi:uncharacterized protein [Aegilops tauschii subsp. strangulata]|uniref:uncharacterized protein n=1 Tax=Aegilops tauschii subsp. strangulata TaxID=200361 RepID=UPI00098A810D|nr:uncharacterized protein LOC109736685 [Aegilops tauschii subsp. strangulata]
MSSSSSTVSNPFAGPDVTLVRDLNIHERVPVKLDQNTASYSAWKRYFSLVFREYLLHGHMDGTVDSALMINDEEWMILDATIIRWFYLTISSDLFHTVMDNDDDAYAVWTKLNGLFTDNRLQRKVLLHGEFYGTLTAGLNEDFGNAASNLTLITEPTFAKVVAYLKLEERRMRMALTRATHTALIAGTRGAQAPPPPRPTPPQPAAPALPPGFPPAPAAPFPPPQPAANGGERGRPGGRRGGHKQGGAGAQGGAPRPPQQAYQPAPWYAGQNPWTGVVHTYSMPVPRAPAPGILGARPPSHQAFYAAPQPYAAPYGQQPQPGGLPLLPLTAPPQPLPPAPWDPALVAALHTAPSPSSYTGGGDWYMDTGATAHMAAYPGNLHTSYPVHTSNRITVGDGSSLPITHIGHAYFPSNSTPISMSNVLVSPELIKNLVSVRSLTRENPVTVEFDECGFSVKDARTRMVLHRCDSPDELYPVHSATSTTFAAPVALATGVDLCNTGFLYYLVILDDFSHYLWTFPLRRKSDAISTLATFYSYVLTQFGRPILALQTDNGMEFDNLVVPAGTPCCLVTAGHRRPFGDSIRWTVPPGPWTASGFWRSSRHGTSRVSRPHAGASPLGLLGRPRRRGWCPSFTRRPRLRRRGLGRCRLGLPFGHLGHRLIGRRLTGLFAGRVASGFAGRLAGGFAARLADRSGVADWPCYTG